MGSEIARYKQACGEVNSARGKVQRLAELFYELGLNLKQRPLQVMVSNVSVGFPPEVALARDYSVNANEMVNGQGLAEALSAYHKALSEARKAFSAIPDEERDVVQPPPQS